jgi:Zn-finger nucleic acid-binding protein
MMPRHVGKSGIVVDVCGEHGIWLDCDELSHLIAWMRAGGLEIVQEMVGNLKGSPDRIRKRLSLETEKPKRRSTPSIGGGSLADWGTRRERTPAEMLIEIGLPLLAVLAGTLAKVFLK